MIGYTCKYTPLELLSAFGMEHILLNAETESFDCAENCTHNHLCCHTKAVIQQCAGGSVKNLMLTNCCDSVRRTYDVLEAEGNMEFLHFLDLPHTNTPAARKLFAQRLTALAQVLEQKTGRTFDPGQFYSAFEQPIQMPEEPYIGILGARVPDGLKERIQRLIPMPVVDLTCAGNRSVQPPETRLENLEDCMDWYAGTLLSQLPCMRMEDVSARLALVQSEHLAGVLYHTVKFCDYYGFEYETMRQHLKIPMLKLETDFTPQADGQLSTRIGAFMEQFIQEKKQMKKENGSGYVAGIDSGSTSTNVVILDRDKQMLASAVVRTGARANIGARQALSQALLQAGLQESDLDLILATGYGREKLAQAGDAVTEITCHAKGARYLCPDARILIDIGGQDSKAVLLAEDGSVQSFVMNDKCAAGTGRFLEMMAHTLGMELEKLGPVGLKWKKDLTISSMCTVFAESEVVSLVADNHETADIVHGLHKAVASKTAALAGRVGKDGPYVMTGGVARNPGVVKALEEKLETKLLVPEQPELCGALGAALFALERV